MIQGSSIDDSIADQVRVWRTVLNALWSCWIRITHAHVLRELELYAPLVTKDCYLVVCDTLIEQMPAGSFPDRPWDKGIIRDGRGGIYVYQR